MEELPPRPAPAVSVAEQVRAWIVWIGPLRLALSAVAIVIVGAGGYWLVRSPAPSPESALPRAAPATSAPVTLAPPAAPATVAGPVVVHVSGAVERPGVYELAAGDRVQDAVDRAGGPTADGDPNAINLAAAVVDGARIHVPAFGEEVVETAPDDATSAPVGPVDVNRATAAELDRLPGVGPATATAIVTERERNGPFVSVDDLERVPGIGPAKLDALRDLVTT